MRASRAARQQSQPAPRARFADDRLKRGHLLRNPCNFSRVTQQDREYRTFSRQQRPDSRTRPLRTNNPSPRVRHVPSFSHMPRVGRPQPIMAPATGGRRRYGSHGHDAEHERGELVMKLLAVVEGASTARACLSAAASLVPRLRSPASIAALHIIVDMAHAVMSSEEVAMQQLLEMYHGTAVERASATREVFGCWLAEEPARTRAIHLKEITGAVKTILVQEAREMDLLVLARPCTDDGRHALHTAFFVCGRPLLLVPENWCAVGASLGAHIAIAWNGTPACRRAVIGATPWLREADRITIILIGADRGKAGDGIGPLGADGVAPSYHRVARSPAHLGQQIIDEARSVGADLLVAGAYRHGPALEWLAGRTTRQMLRRADMPLFLAH